MAFSFPAAVRNAMLDAITTYAGSAALLRIYNGTRPATGGTATTLLAELPWTGAMAAAAASGSLTFNIPTNELEAPATGTATWARIVKADGVTVVMDMDASVTGGTGDITLDSVAITQFGTVGLTSGTLTAGNS